MIAINITQFASESEMACIEAEAAITAASMKLHTASKNAVRCLQSFSRCQEALKAHIQQTGLLASDLCSYYLRRELLANECSHAASLLAEAEEAEASAEVEWESAVQRLTDLLQ